MTISIENPEGLQHPSENMFGKKLRRSRFKVMNIEAIRLSRVKGLVTQVY